MARQIIYRKGRAEDLTPDQVDANFQGLDDDLKALSLDVEGLQESAGGRRSLDADTGILAPGANAFLELPLGKAYSLLTVATNFPARVRVYATASHRAADASRTVDKAPENDHGLVAEVVTAASLLALHFAPMPFGANQEAIPSAAAYLAVTNTDVVPRSIKVSFSRLILEA